MPLQLSRQQFIVLGSGGFFLFMLFVFHMKGVVFQSQSASSREEPDCVVKNVIDQTVAFNALGPITDTSCRRKESFGSGDGEKRLCMDDIDPHKPCTVFSLGSSGVWDFEEDIVARTHCTVDTFDCTGDYPAPEAIRHRVKSHKICVGPKTEGAFMTWRDVVRTYGRPTVLKMDIEGWEWPVLRQINTETFPTQLAVEIHICNLPHRPLHLPNPMETIAELMVGLGKAGYRLMDRHDNPGCYICSEVVFRVTPGEEKKKKEVV